MGGRATRAWCAGAALAIGASVAAGWLAGLAGAAGTNGWSISPGPESITVTWSGFAAGESLSVAVSGAGKKFQCAASSASCTVTGLTDGVSYTVSASVGDATGTVSSTTGSATPFTTPGPVSVNAAPGDGQILVKWSPPSSDGGSPVTSYVAQAAGPSGQRTCTSATTSCTITGLANGTQYAVTAAALNAAGRGPWSATALATPVGAPGRVGSLTVTRDAADRLVASWRAPSDDGGSPLTGYQLRYSSDAVTWTRLSASSGRPMAGIDETGAYLFEVAALNAIGAGPWSAPVRGPPMVVSRAASRVTASPIGTGSTYVVRVRLRDASGLAVAARSVTLSGGLGQPRHLSDARGVATFVVGGTGTVRLRATSGAVSIGEVKVAFSGAVGSTTTSRPRSPSTTSTTSESTTTTSPRTTTSAPSTSLVTTTSAHVGPSAGATVRIAFDAGVGLKVARYRVEVTGRGLEKWAGQTARISVHSAEVLLASTTVTPAGTFRSVVHLPATLAAGVHHLIVRVGAAGVVGTQAFFLAGGRVTAIGAPFTPLAAYAPYVPADHSHELLGVTAGLMVVLAALGARARRKGRDGGGLVDVELERVRGDDPQDGGAGSVRGWLERWSRSAPGRWSRVSPVLGRVASDGDYLRAALGPAWLAFCLAATGLGVAAAGSSRFYPVVPTWGWLLGLTLLGIFDAAWGLLAGVAWAAAMVLSGHVATTNEVRGVLGTVLLWFAVSLAAGSIAPLRRRLVPGLRGAWVRGADLVVASAFGGFAALEMSRALSPLFGVEFGAATRPARIAVAAAGAVALRMLFETVVAHRARERLAAVLHEGDFEAGRAQMALSLVVQIATFWFVSTNVVSGWTLVAGTVVFFLPLVAGLRDWPVVSWIAEHRAGGALKWCAVIGAGAGLAWLVEHAGLREAAVLKVGFVVLALPVVTTWTLELFDGGGDELGASPRSDQSFRWGSQLGGAVMVGVVIWLVVAGGAGA